jgi:hypothetical protein
MHDDAVFITQLHNVAQKAAPSTSSSLILNMQKYQLSIDVIASE